MFWDHVTINWADCSALLSRHFPHHPIPRAAPSPHGRDEFVAALARAHQLTQPEVLEMLDYIFHLALARAATPRLATVQAPSDGIWPL